LHFANISVKGLAVAKLKKMASKPKEKPVAETPATEKTTKESLEKENVSEEKLAKNVAPKKTKPATKGEIQKNGGDGKPVEGSKSAQDDAHEIGDGNPIPTPQSVDETVLVVTTSDKAQSGIVEAVVGIQEIAA